MKRNPLKSSSSSSSSSSIYIYIYIYIYFQTTYIIFTLNKFNSYNFKLSRIYNCPNLNFSTKALIENCICINLKIFLNSTEAYLEFQLYAPKYASSIHSIISKK